MSMSETRKKVTTLKQVMELAQSRKAVIGKQGRAFGSRPCSASFVAGLPARYLYNLMQTGLYVYEKEQKP